MIRVDFQGDMFQGTITFTLEFVPRVGEKVTIPTEDGQSGLIATVADVNWILGQTEGHSASVRLVAAV